VRRKVKAKAKMRIKVGVRNEAHREDVELPKKRGKYVTM